MIGTIHLTALVLGLSLHLVHVAAYSEITPVQAGSAISARGLKAKRACDADSWIPDDHRAEYTRPANGTQIMRAAVSGPAAIYITKTRSQSSTTSTDLTSEDIVSLGVGLEMVEMVEDSAPSTFHVAEGQTGDIGFTPFLVCTSGTGRCNGDEVTGEICTAKVIKDRDGTVTLDGMYTLIVTS